MAINLKEEPYVSVLSDRPECLDYLTGLYAKNVCNDLIRKMIQAGNQFSVLQANLDNFKYINDVLGQSAGDLILKELGESLKSEFSEEAIVGRLGGDTYMMIIPDVTEYDEVWAFCRRVNTVVNGFTVPEMKGNRLTVTIGLSRFPIDGKTMDEISAKADIALYRGKQKGRNCFIIYLLEKHGSIRKAANVESAHANTEMADKVSSMLTATPDMKQNIENLFAYLSQVMMIDHLGIQSFMGLLYSKIHPLSYSRDFEMIEENVLQTNSNSMGICTVNSIAQLTEMKNFSLQQTLVQQGITATTTIKISAYDETFGYLRADMTTPEGRLWQDKNVAILLMTARLLAILLSEHHTDLESILLGEDAMPML